MSGLKLPKHKKISEELFLENLKPDSVTFPLISGNDTNVELLVKLGDHVKKDEVIARRKEGFKTNIISSVSGIFKEIKEVTMPNGRKVDCIVIENDFKEERKVKETNELTKYSKEEFIDRIYNNAVLGMGGAGFPTFMKYKTDKRVDILLINAIECEPYITADYKVMMLHMESILKCIDAILTINNIKKCVFAIKETNKQVIEEISKYIGTYPNIELKLMRNVYPMGWEKFLINEALGLTYDRLPIEKNIIVNNVSTIYAIYNSLKYNKGITERIITVSGEGVTNPCNINTKVGVTVNDLLKLAKVNDRNGIIISGGPMMGSNIDKNTIITPEMNCILVINKVEKKEVECLRCGKCVNACPAGICPVLIKDNINDLETLKKLHPEKCIGCGLCSYTCPSGIMLRDIVASAKEKVLKEDRK